MSGVATGGNAGLLKRLAAGIGLAKPPKKAKSGLPTGADTKTSQTLDQALGWLALDSAKRVLVSGDRGFLNAVTAKAPGLVTTWTSCLVEDLQQGAANPDQIDLDGYDAVLCGGSQAGLSFRHAVARMAEVDSGRPVHWVGQDWEFCGGTLPVPSQAEDAEALLFNHFQHFFGIKDPLLFRIEIYHGAERKHFTRILQPNESVVIRLSDHFPKRSQAACIAAFVAHPILTRGRHYRLRVCADVFWRDSFTTLHSAHEFQRSPSHKFEFRASQEILRSGEIVLTVPNYARDLGEDRALIAIDGQDTQTRTRDSAAYLEEVKATRNGGSHPFFGWKYRGYGGSFWYSFEDQQALMDGHRGSLSANHHASVPVEDRADWSTTPEELAELARLREAGFMVEPSPVPVAGETDELQYGIDFDSANPRFNRFRLFLFSGSGAFLGERAFEKTERGPFFPGAIVRGWNDPALADTRLAIVTPDWQAIKTRRKGFKIQSDFIIQNRRTGDRDITEFQTCWRNCGVIVPGMAHFGGPAAAAYGRTNLFARARTGGGYRTALLSINASGSVGYKRNASAEITVFNAEGRARSAGFAMPPFGWRLDWIDDLIPDLAAHLGKPGNGALLVGSKNADLNAQIVTVSDKGAVSLQHMWGY
ncbi:hypothetical protein [Dongia sedimenti]|uniref:Uncharacterized protein n=1 Tax=Dongia sedimenti TaxID=3064282 RepID=A0ABU0YQ97_9PROT|nr:hypothetical protein [Rhodospirillaceae bacterium R-7]